MTGENVVSSVLSAIVGLGGGFLGAIVTFRTRLAVSDLNAKRREDDALEVTRQNVERFDRIERRQKATLQLIADIARTLGADKRFSDGLLRYLSEEI